MPSVRVQSEAEPGTTFEVNPEAMTCSCQEWREKRSGFESGDPRRLCRHLLAEHLRRQPILPDDDPLKGEERTLRRLQSFGNGFPVCRFYESLNVMGWDYDVFFPLDVQNPWAEVYSDDGAYLFNHIEKRWANQNEPVESEALAQRLAAISDQERGRRKTARAKRRLRFSVRIGIVALTSFLIILAGALVLGVSSLGGKRSVGVLMQSILRDSARDVMEKTTAYLTPAQNMSLPLVRYLGQRGDLNQAEASRFMEMLSDVLRSHSQFMQVAYADRQGNAWMALRMPDGSLSRRSVVRDGPVAVTTWLHENPEWSETLRHAVDPADAVWDPREEPWFRRAVQRRDPVWTDVYVFDASEMPGLTCAVPVRPADGEPAQGVLGVSIGLADMALFLDDIRVGKTGRAYIVNTSGEIVSMPISARDKLYQLVQRFPTAEGGVRLQLRPATVAPDPAFAESARLYLEQQGGEDGFLDFRVEKTDYVAYYAGFPPGRMFFPWEVAVVAPEDDFMGPIRSHNQIVLYLSAAFILLAVVVGIRLSRMLSHPLNVLADDMYKIRNFHLDTGHTVASPLIEVDEMGRALDNMKTGLRSFRKFVPADLVRDLIALGQEAALGGENREITTMFSDIADFTTLSERHNPGDLVVRLGEYFSLMGTVIHQQHGTVDKYIGDSVMAFWGAPMLLEDHAFRACRAALYCREVLSHLAHEWQSSPIPMFHTRFGIHSGKAIVGNMGSTERLNYTALGDSINLASRLEGLNKQYGTAILISEATYEQVKERMEVRLLDQVAVKGRSEPVHIYELLGEKGCLDTAAAEQVRRYEDAYRKYLERDFAGALQGFRAVLEQNGDDGPSQVFVKRCELYMQTPPGAEWSGVFKATSK